MYLLHQEALRRQIWAEDIPRRPPAGGLRAAASSRSAFDVGPDLLPLRVVWRRLPELNGVEELRIGDVQADRQFGAEQRGCLDVCWRIVRDRLYLLLHPGRNRVVHP